jgi:energy-coupling factor transporter ATP-binding protein EcfA2
MRITSIRARNFLGFGEEGVLVEGLEESTVIVGPNGSGKTSLFRVLEFVAQQLEGRSGFARRSVEPEWFHQQDTGRELIVEVGVRLNDSEMEAAVQSGILGLMHEPISVLPGHIGNLNRRTATEAIYLVHSKCRGLFEPWLGGELFFTVKTSPGRMSIPDVYVRTSGLATDFAVVENGVARNPYRNLHNIFRLESEVWAELAHRFAGKFDQGQPNFVLSDESAQGIASQFTPDWLYANLVSKGEEPVMLQLVP